MEKDLLKKIGMAILFVVIGYLFISLLNWTLAVNEWHSIGKLGLLVVGIFSYFYVFEGSDE